MCSSPVEKLPAQPGRGCIPVDPGLQVGHRRQQVDQAVTGRRQARVGDGGDVHVEGWVFRQPLVCEDGVQVGVVIFGEVQRLVPHVRVGLIHAQVQDITGAGVLHLVQFFSAIAPLVGRGDQIAVGVGQVGVGDHQVSR